MNPSAIGRLILSLACLSVGATDAAPPPKPAMRDAATHEQLAARLQKIQQADPMKKLTATQGEDPSVVNRPPDLLSQSDVLCCDGFATLVPKRALLQVPKEWEGRTRFAEGSRVVSWPEFLMRNRGWLQTVEVTRVQAEGKAALSDETRRSMAQARGVVVATYQGGPISVLAGPADSAAPSAPAKR